MFYQEAGSDLNLISHEKRESRGVNNSTSVYIWAFKHLLGLHRCFSSCLDYKRKFMCVMRFIICWKKLRQFFYTVTHFLRINWTIYWQGVIFKKKRNRLNICWFQVSNLNFIVFHCNFKCDTQRDLSVKNDIIILEKKMKRKSKRFRSVQSNRNECNDQLSNTNRPERPQRTTQVHEDLHNI